MNVKAKKHKIVIKLCEKLFFFFSVTYPQYSMYLYITIAMPIAIAANKTDVMSIIERHKDNPMNERILEEKFSQKK